MYSAFFLYRESLLYSLDLMYSPKERGTSRGSCSPHRPIGNKSGKLNVADSSSGGTQQREPSCIGQCLCTCLSMLRTVKDCAPS